MAKQIQKYIVVLITAKDTEEAQKISQVLLDQHLVACANIISPIQSVFWWQGKLDKATEVLLVLKTHKVLFKRIIKEVRACHSYSVPEIMALPILDGNLDYLKWVDESLRDGISGK